ncbi:hypothetical protein BSTEL_0665 [Bifidobacterium stellenboschense]|uniref:Uncharacterized protein n=1 Tax=Bifidobacterium stellenboschense TaxID=762211 RepID=A0A087DQQ4_9BIFI|nr:hypothetical protein BSTEL_0665 [Bifidobacterium stellenboschense]
MSGRDLAKAIHRGPTYVRERINDEKEWALGDIERMCLLWSLKPSQLIEGAPMVDSTDTPAALAGEREDIDIDAWADRIREEDGVRAGGSAVPTSRMR